MAAQAVDEGVIVGSVSAAPPLYNTRRMAIYLDHSATTPLAPAVRAAMEPYLTHGFGNAASLHSFGREATAALDEAHFTAGCAIGARASEIIFTSGGTESDNLALRGILLGLKAQTAAPALAISAIEHHAVSETAAQLERHFGHPRHVIAVDGQGRVDPSSVAATLDAAGGAIKLVSVMMANNEIGTVQAIAEIAAICHARGCLLHTDAVQCPAYLPVDVNALGVDALSLSAHKVYGPKGIGILYLRDGVPFISTATGGGHERDRRAGTVNVAGAVGAAEALKRAASRRAEETARLTALRDRLIAGVLAQVPEVVLTGHPTERLAHLASFAFKGVDGEVLQMALDVEGIAVSTGSACTSGSPEPSEVLLAIGLAREWALGGLRFSLGESTTEADIARVIEVLPTCVVRARAAVDFPLRPATGPAR